jgi:cobalt-zinc-cadmium efflux system protein
MTHNHGHSDVTARSKTLLLVSGALTALTFVGEAAGGIWTNSVALLSDAGHVFMDLVALTFSYFALRLADRPASDRRTFGLHRAEVFAAFLNGALVAVIAVWIIVEAAARFRDPPAVKTIPMILIAVIGLVVNVGVAWYLHGFAAKDVNIRGAFLHVASDALASLGVVGGGLLVYFTGRLAIDPLVAVLVALVIVVNAVRLLKDSVHILLEGVPKGLEFQEVVGALKAVPGVEEVEDVHIWSICSHIHSLSAHVVLPESGGREQRDVLENLHRVLKERFRIEHATLQVRFAHWPPVPKPLDQPPSRRPA